MKNRIVAGVDEAGRGPLAGDVYAAAVIFHPDKSIEGLGDSKKLSLKRREDLYHIIKEQALYYSIHPASVEEIEKINILKASCLAMERCLSDLKDRFNFVQVDGNFYPFTNIFDGEAVVKGDSKIREIMAASILAKVEMDHYMNRMDRLYPEYGFAKHKGYPTKEHRNLILKHGPCPIHRKLFKGVKEFYQLELF